MPRPPSTDSGDRPWSPPLWLVGERQVPKPRSVSVPLPPIAPTVKAHIQLAIKQKLSPFHAEQQEIDYWKAKYNGQTQRVHNLQNKLAQLEQRKEQGLLDLRERQKSETAASLRIWEESLTKKYEQECEQTRKAWRKSLEDECREKRKDALQGKRKALQDEFRVSKRPRIESVPSTELVHEKQTELQELQHQVDELQETRTEMVWLLKQVIKAEEKHKGMDKKPQAAKTMASKQA